MSEPTATYAFPFQEQAAKFQEQYKHAYDAAIKGWTEAVQGLSAQVSSSSPDLKVVIDRAYDLAEVQLRAQRDYVRGAVEAYARANATKDA
jgi:hypothetical protein